MPKIHRLEALDENDLLVGVVTIPRRYSQVPGNTITWACGVPDCAAMGDSQSNAANAVAALEEHLTLTHDS
jgi:hypothetical protein